MGGGEHTWHLLSDMGELRSSISVIIDQKGYCPEIEIETIEPCEINNCCIDCIIVSSYIYRKDIINEFVQTNTNKGIEIIDLYEILSLNGYVLTGNYYEYARIDWRDLFFVKNKMLISKDKSKKAKYYHELIAMYIFLRDFYSAFSMINQMPEETYYNIDKYKSFRNELIMLFNQIKLELAVKKNIIINWIDGLMPCELYDMDFLRHVADNGIEFQNAYTAVPITSMAMAVMHTGKYPIEDMLSPVMFFEHNNSKLIKMLEEREFEFCYCGQHHWRKFALKNKCEKYRVGYPFVPMTIYQWEAICQMFDRNEQLCIMIHNVLETHVPNISGNLEAMRLVSHLDVNYDYTGGDEVGMQIKRSRQWLDKELEWYSDFYSKNNLKIYMSDHGKAAVNNDCFNKMTDQIVLLVNGLEIKTHKISGFFSNINFSDFLESLIDKKNYNELLCDYVKIERVDTYERARNIRVLNDAINDENYKILNEFAYKIVRGKEGYYVIRANGDEILSVDNGEPSIFLQKARKIATNIFIDVYKHSEYAESRILYEYFNINKDDDIIYI